MLEKGREASRRKPCARSRTIRRADGVKAERSPRPTESSDARISLDAASVADTCASARNIFRTAFLRIVFPGLSLQMVANSLKALSVKRLMSGAFDARMGSHEIRPVLAFNFLSTAPYMRAILPALASRMSVTEALLDISSCCSAFAPSPRERIICRILSPEPMPAKPCTPAAVPCCAALRTALNASSSGARGLPARSS